MSHKEQPHLTSRLEGHIKLWKQLSEYDGKQLSAFLGDGMKVFRDEKIADILLISAGFQSCIFERCEFTNTKFNDCNFGDCEFKNCVFQNCEISNTILTNNLFEDTNFKGSAMVDSVFADAMFSGTVFSECWEILGVRFGGCSYPDLLFYDCNLSRLSFENTIEAEWRNIHFINCEVSHSTFSWLNLTSSVFNECNLSFNSFNNCEITEHTLSPSNKTTDEEFNSIDFQTILKSNISIEILKNQFGIFSAELKQYIMEMVNKVQLHTAFISYSFKDRQFASNLNEALKRRGVFTFLWEKDSIAGQKIKKIMSYNVNKFDKLLFIASENSLKSEACQFELTNARIKQDKNWGEVFFPIHIDNFLFSVHEDDIPRKHREDFWRNIEELREVNSMEFTQYASSIADKIAFDRQIDRLILGLRNKEST